MGKRSLLTETADIPVGLATAGANTNDFKLLRQTLDSIPVERPRPTDARPQGQCLDKGYDCRCGERRKAAGSRRIAMIRASGCTAAIAAAAVRDHRYCADASPTS